MMGVQPTDFIRYRVEPSKTETVDAVDFALSYRDTLDRAYSQIGRVRPHRFWRLTQLGDTQVFFQQRAPSKQLRLSVMLLWDFSGSQEGFRPELIYSLSSVGASLRRVGVNVWAAAYTDGHGVELFEVCSWGEQWDHRRTAALSVVDMSGTPTAEAMHYVRRIILPGAPHHRRLLVVCTDGAPNHGPSATMREVKAFRACGCLVAGLYVGDDPRRARGMLVQQYGERFSFVAPRRKDIPLVVNQILGRLLR